MSNYAKVKEHNDIVRDMDSKAILNIDRESLENHRRKKTVMKSIVENNEKIHELDNDVKEIKQMLSCLLERYKV
jgi:carbamoylphosphate synthase small subunit